MKKTIKIEGMMCGHCSGRVEAMAGVETAEVSHETGMAAVTLNGHVSDEALAKAVTDAGYKVAGIE